MAVHITTGNRVDVVIDRHGEYSADIKPGLYLSWQSHIIPLPEPQGLLEVLERAIRETEASE